MKNVRSKNIKVEPDIFAGFDIGGTNIKAIIADGSGRTVAFFETGTPGTASGIDTEISGIIERIPHVLSSDYRLRAIGIGAAGSINREKGTVIVSPNILCWRRYPLAGKIGKITGIKVFLENDANVACAGVWWGNGGEKYSNFVTITLGTGIGGGAVIDGRLFTGQNGSSMEIGHTTVESGGRECTCGNRGCLEQYASATGLVRYVTENLDRFPASSIITRMKSEKITSSMIYEEAVKSDELALEGFDYSSYYLGIGVANIINILNPQAVFFGGGLSRAHSLIIPRVKKVVMERALDGMKEKVRFSVIRNQSVIPALGAARIAMERYRAEQVKTPLP